MKKKISFETETGVEVSVKSMNDCKCEMTIGKETVVLDEEEAMELADMLNDAVYGSNEDVTIPGMEDDPMKDIDSIIGDIHGKDFEKVNYKKILKDYKERMDKADEAVKKAVEQFKQTLVGLGVHPHNIDVDWTLD